MANFEPRPHDALEDALEHLDLDSRPGRVDSDFSGPAGPRLDSEADLASLGLAPELLERLAEYRQVLALTRDAFPLEDPAEGLLDGVLAEAREVARNTPVARLEQPGGWRRAWDRWRSNVIPVATLAGAAALVLWIAKPGDDPSRPQLARIDDPAPALDDATLKAKADSAASQAVEAAGSASEADLEPAPPTPTSDAPPPVEAPPGKAAGKRKQADGIGDASSAGAGSGSAPSVAPNPIEPLSKDDAWTDLERADAARRRGDCDQARTLYETVVAASTQSATVARAKAGIGLCFEQDGKSTKANEWFDDARTSNPGVDAWIRGQRDAQPLPGEKKKSKANSAEFDDLVESL